MANAIWCIINYIPEECIVFSNWQKVQWENYIRVLLSTTDNSQFKWTCIYNNQLITYQVLSAFYIILPVSTQWGSGRNRCQTCLFDPISCISFHNVTLPLQESCRICCTLVNLGESWICKPSELYLCHIILKKWASQPFTLWVLYWIPQTVKGPEWGRLRIRQILPSVTSLCNKLPSLFSSHILWESLPISNSINPVSFCLSWSYLALHSKPERVDFRRKGVGSKRDRMSCSQKSF